MSETKHNKRIVTVGGGTGTYTVLTGLKKYCDVVDLTAVVAMTDSGGSTGRLRDEFGYLPVGDVRMALAALANEDTDHDTLVRKLFLHRFNTNGQVSGHNFGNLFLMALTDILGSEEEAVRAAARVLRVCGTVLPVTHEKVHLTATYADGRTVVGEHEIDEPSVEEECKILDLAVTPRATLNPRVADAFARADMIIFGPGDLYTSVLANCVVDGFSDALARAPGKMLYISNLMTKAGQTTGMGLADHVAELARFSGRVPGVILANSTALPEDLVGRYAMEREYPVVVGSFEPACLLRTEDLLSSGEIVKSEGDVLKRSFIRHDSEKLAQAIMSILEKSVQ